MTDRGSSPGSELSSATEAVRQSARWIATAFAGVGALLVAGLQLRDLTQERLAPIQLVWAGAALLVVLAGVTWVVYSASQVLTSYFSTVGQVNRLRLANEMPDNVTFSPDVAVPGWVRTSLIDAIDANSHTLLAVPIEMDNLEDQLARTSKALHALSTGHEHYVDSGGQGWKKTELQALKDVRDRLSLSSERVVQFSNDFVARTMYRRFRRVAFFGAILTLVGIVIFVMATDAQDRGLAITQPTRVDLSLTEQGRTEIGTRVGEQCVQGSLKGVAISGGWLEPIVAIPRSGICRAATITLTRRLGTAVPTP